MSRASVLAAVTSALAVAMPAAAHASAHADRVAVRHVAQRYLDAIAHRHPAVVCRLLTPTAREDLLGDEPAGTTCRQAAAHIEPELGRFPIVAVHVDGRRATAVIGDAAVSDSGDDGLPLVKRGGRWLLDGV